MANKDLVYLVNAGNDPSQSAIANDGSFPAAGVLALGTWLQNRMQGEVDVICRDGQVHSMDKIKQDIEKNMPGVVGISTLCTSYQNALEIAEAAKSVGSKVVLGNDHASQNAIAIIDNQRDVDYVLGAEYGELPLELLVRRERGENIPLEEIPSLTYRDSHGSAIGFDFERDKQSLSILDTRSGYSQLLQRAGIPLKPSTALNLFPVINRNLFPQSHHQAYLSNYLDRFAHMHVDKEFLSSLKKQLPHWNEEGHSDRDAYHAHVVAEAQKYVSGVSTMNRARGCNRRPGMKYNDVCKHCDITGVRVGESVQSTPELFWEEVQAAFDQIGANSLYEVSDSFISFPNLLRGVAESRPSNLSFNPQLFVYGQARDIANHPERVQMLKDMGVFRVNLGLESMCDTTLKHMKSPRDSVEQNYRALEHLKDAGIHVYASFVLGSEAETPYSLRQTTERVIDLLKRGYLSDVEAQPVLPLAGNYQGGWMKNENFWVVDKEHPDWPINVDDMSRTYINASNKFGVTYDDCIAAANEIRAAARSVGANFGSGVSARRNYSP